MTTTRSSFFISGAVIALIIIAPLVALAAWSEPSQAPTGGNVDPPINTGSGNQVKNGGLSVNTLAVFGSTAINGNTYLKTGVTGSIYRYLNFGVDYDVDGNVIASTIEASGYGIRDKDGMLEFKNLGGSWQSIQAILWELCGGPCGGGGGGSTTPTFRASKDTSQSVTPGVWAKLTWPVEEFDTNNNFANNRFTPTVPGKYLFTLSVSCVGQGGAHDHCAIQITKNNTKSVAESDPGLHDSGTSIALNASGIVEMNGTTDYVEAYAYNGYGNAIVLNNFSGALLSP
ncbi:MAG: hypothetical protein WAL02_17195 [Rhodoplanes sp.]